MFLYCEVLEIKLPWLDNVTQANAPKKLPVVLTVNEAQALLSRYMLSKGSKGVVSPLDR